MGENWYVILTRIEVKTGVNGGWKPFWFVESVYLFSAFSN